MDFKRIGFVQLTKDLQSENIIEKHKGVIGIRKYFADPDKMLTPQIQSYVNDKLIRICISLLNQNQFLHLKYQAAFILCNLGLQHEFCESMSEMGVIELCVSMIKNQKEELQVVSNIIWALGNIAADAPKFRDQVVAADGINALLTIIKENKSRELIELTVWTLCNLCRGEHVKNYKNLMEISKATCQILKKGVLKLKQEEIVSDIMWTLSYICDGQQKRIDMIYQQDILKHIMAYLPDSNIKILAPAFRILGNISTGNDKHTGVIVENGFLNMVPALLNHPRKTIRREACWILSNIAAESFKYIETILNKEEIFRMLKSLFNSDDITVRLEIAYIVANITSNTQIDKQRVLNLCCEIRYIENIVQLLKEVERPNKLCDLLRNLQTILTMDNETENKALINRINVSGGFQKIEQLQTHQNSVVYEIAVRILQKFAEIQ